MTRNRKLGKTRQQFAARIRPCTAWDPYGNVMYKPSYGKSSEMGWDVDHITSKARGGSDATRNLQALNSSVNRSKGDTLQKKSRHSK